MTESFMSMRDIKDKCIEINDCRVAFEFFKDVKGVPTSVSEEFEARYRMHEGLHFPLSQYDAFSRLFYDAVNGC